MTLINWSSGLTIERVTSCECLDGCGTRYQTEAGSGIPTIDRHGESMESNKYKNEVTNNTNNAYFQLPHTDVKRGLLS